LLECLQGGLGRALDNTANDFMRATADVSRELVTSNPLDFLKTGYVVQLVSKLCGKSLRVLENGVLDCGGDTGTACESCNRLISDHQPVVFLSYWLL
jgi:hypothetical protein